MHESGEKSRERPQRVLPRQAEERSVVRGPVVAREPAGPTRRKAASDNAPSGRAASASPPVESRVRRIANWLLTPSARWSLLALVGTGFVGGVLFWGALHTAIDESNRIGFCTSCHVMRDFAFKEYATTIHFQNRTGVQASCADCHVPREWLPKMLRKVHSTNELWHWLRGSIDTPEKFEAKRLELAISVWNRMKQTDSLECRNCHTLQSMSPDAQGPAARAVHQAAFASGQTCIDCHKGIAHKSPRDRLSPEELQRLEAPAAVSLRPAAPVVVAGAPAPAASRAAADPAPVPPRAAAQQQAQATPAGDRPASAAGGARGGIDWAAVPARTVTLFYPGVSSFEWLQAMPDHLGASVVAQGDQRCAICHDPIIKSMGEKIVGGSRNEPTPIQGKRPWIELTAQAAHDGTNLFLRFAWRDGPHVAVPFVAGGKMDPDNAVKFSLMIAGTGIAHGDQAGCWVKCHNDLRSMPDAGKVDLAGARAAGLDPDAPGAALAEGLTSYLAESRTRIELQGRTGPRGGGLALKPAADLAALRQAGTVLELVRLRPNHAAESGWVLAQRRMDGGVPVEGTLVRDGDRWVATLRRPLTPDRAGAVALVPGRVYAVGLAVHDDFAAARFHHVSLGLRLALDNPAVELDAVKVPPAASR